MIKSIFNVKLFFTYAFILLSHSAAAKPFKRAVVIAGGGVNVATSIGILAGLKSKGWEPDVIFTSCGASIGGAIYNMNSNEGAALDFAKSAHLHSFFLQTDIGIKKLLDLNKAIENFKAAIGIPSLFGSTVLTLPSRLDNLFKLSKLQNHGPRLVMMGVRAEFNERDVGKTITDRYTEVMFTDSDTAQYLVNVPSAKKRFPGAFIAPVVEVLDQFRPEDGVRASMSDPLLINPAIIDGEYYFTGAANLHPIDAAMSIADEVMVTYPDGLYQDFENMIMKNSFGYTAQERSLLVNIRHDVKWIDVDGNGRHNFNPKPVIANLTLKNGIPQDLNAFQKGVQKQYDFGFKRGAEAAVVQKNKLNVRSHLRNRINESLYYDFSCKNARVWKTTAAAYCTSDARESCDRRRASSCTPLR